MKKLLTFLMMSVLAIGVGWADEVTDVLTRATTGVTGTNYTSWSGKTLNSAAVYAGQSAGGNNSIQLRTTNSNSGIITTGSGGKVKSVTIAFNSNTASGRTVDIYGKNTAYSDPTDLYNSSTRGTKIGSIVYGTSTSITVSGDYAFMGLRSNNGALYIESITIVWEDGTSSSGVATPVISGTTPFVGSTQVSISCETSGASIYYTTDGNAPTTSSTLYSAPFTINATTTVKAIAVKNGQTSNVASMLFTALQAISSIAEFNGLDVNDNFKYTGNNLVYIKSNSGGNNHYVQDGSKGMLIYGSLDQTYQPGDVIPGGFTGTRAEFNGAPEMTNPDGFTASSQNVGLTPIEITPSQVNLDNFGRYVVIKNAAINGSNLVVDGENVSFYNSLGATLPTNTEGKIFNVKGVVGAYNGNAQILPIEFEEITIVTTFDYYLIGTFNEWAQQDENYKFTARADGSYVLDNKTLPDGVRFKILKVDGNDVSWLGGSAGDYFGITKDVCTNIQLVDGADFYMEVGGNCTFTVSADLKLTVSKEAQLFMKGSYSNDDWSTKTPLNANNSGWTITMDFDANTQFGFVDEWGNWHGGNGYLIKAEHMGTEIPMVGNGNYVFENASNYTLNINNELTKLVVTDNNAVIEGDYVKVTSNDQLTSGIYLIVYEDGSLAFNGGLETLDAVGNSIEVEISDNVIPASTEVNAAAFTYDAIAKTLKSASGFYIGITTDANGLSASSTTAYTNTLSINEAGNADIVSSGGAYLRYNSASNQTRFRYYKSSSYTGQKAIQLYKKGGEIVPTLDAPVIEGETPFVESTTVTITAEEGAAIYYTINGDTPSSESNHYEAPFQLTESATVKAIAIKDDIVSSVASKSFEKIPSVATIAEYKQLAEGTTFVFTGNVAVTYVNGKYLYVKDETGSALIFGNSNFDFTQGQVLETGWKAETTDYNGLLEAKNPENVSATDQTVEIAPEEKAVNAISTANDNEYIIVTNVSITAPENKNFTITDANGNTIVGRTNFTGVDHPTDLDAKYDIICLVGEYNGTVQLYPTEYKAAAVIEPVVLDGVAFTADRQWATWYGDASLALPENVTAYVVTGVQGDAVAVEALDYIPANTGVLLFSETAAESVSAMPYTGDAGTIPTNLLVGGLEAQTVSNAYLLYNNQFILAQDGTTVGAHRCYLPMSASAQGIPVLRIGTPGTVTGIEDLVINGNSDVMYYDLSGRCVGKSIAGKRGIFITSDGKKVVR